jgi:hypothetical protein
MNSPIARNQATITVGGAARGDLLKHKKSFAASRASYRGCK